MSVGTPAGALAAPSKGGSLSEICIGLGANVGVAVDGEADVVTGCEATVTGELGAPAGVPATTVPACGSVVAGRLLFGTLSFKSDELAWSCGWSGSERVRLLVAGRS